MRMRQPGFTQAAPLAEAITAAGGKPLIFPLLEITAAPDPASLAKARELIRKAQWYWDIVAAENGMGAHNPGGNMNTLGQAIDLAHQAIEAANLANSTTKQ